MTITIATGWWLLPLAITIALLGWAFWPRPQEAKSGDYDFSFWLPGAFRFCAAVIATLSSWLIWSLLR